MPHIGNPVQFAGSFSSPSSPNRPSLAIKNFYVGVSGSYGPTTGVDGTGFYSGIGATGTGYYVYYVNKASGGPSIRTPQQNSLVSQIVREEGYNVKSGRTFAMTMQSSSVNEDICVLNKDLEDIYAGPEAIGGRGPWLYFDAGFLPTYVSSSEQIYFVGNSSRTTSTFTTGALFPQNNSSEFTRYSSDNDGYITFGVGEQSYIRTDWNSPTNFQSDFTFDIWFYSSGSQSANTRLINKDGNGGSNGFDIILGTNKIDVTVAGWTSTTDFDSLTFTSDDWNRITVACNSTQTKVSVNNSTYVTALRSGVPPTPLTDIISNRDVFLGSQAGSANFLNGGIAIVMFYTEELTQAQVDKNGNAFKDRFGL